MKLKQDTLILGEDDDKLKNFGLHKDEKFILEEQDIEGDFRNLMGEISNTGSCVKNGLSKCTPQDKFLASESLLSLKEVRFSKQEFSTDKHVSNIKYHHLGSRNNNLFLSVQ